ncbi:TetR/AcrR family transcriptional regulator [Levilactobacillus bambusae]|uniref:HTH tetR-type domain-containing protein n=1 Tax=Levilactobacillus bambusae TaxID=2024736 RepID=A0A2V1N3D4_9LACO|nr:TetR/AcrR family transcriptional regulator [Levilactobacillus bambusae]PWG00520.1 hypothetical protein DCM90_06245 [Levilactobacillus bambusae]
MNTDTEQKIQTAFSTLLQQMDASQITVRKICDSAHISRTTFYTYFSDIDGLYRYLEEIALGGMESILNDWRYLDFRAFSPNEPFTPLLKMHRYILLHESLYAAFMGMHGSMMFRQKFTTVLGASCASFVGRQIHREVTEDDFYLQFYVGGIYNAIYYWLLMPKERRHTPEELAISETKMLRRIISDMQKA